MENIAPADFLFVIVKEFKKFLEAPVILITRIDHADKIYDSLCEMRTAVLIKNDLKEARNILHTFHRNWADNVSDVSSFQKRIRETPRDYIYESVDFTIEAVNKRYKYLKQHMKFHEDILSPVQKNLMATELELIEDMQIAVESVLNEKKKCLQNYTDNTEFTIKVSDECDEVLNWMDKIQDSAALRFSELIAQDVDDVQDKLRIPLETIVNNLQSKSSPSLQNLFERLQTTQDKLGTRLRTSITHELEITKVMEKIVVLEDRIKLLPPDSPALMALEHKKIYLEDRLASLMDIHTKLNSLYVLSSTAFGHRHTGMIFNHLLPEEQREQLIQVLENEWDSFVDNKQQSITSIISILSIADLAKERYSDNYGSFFIDQYGRKLYIDDENNALFQLNEINRLVPISDDTEHTYYYDDCGRYYLNEAKQRIYKCATDTVEYILDPTGIMYKYRENVEGVIYHYDCYGRYYFNADGKKIYKECDDSSEYEDDGLGNLIRIERPTDMQLCKEEVLMTEESDYLRRSVGMALKVCIADCIRNQPADPILYIGKRLLKYRAEQEEREKREKDLKDMNIERERIMEMERLAEEKRQQLEAERLKELMSGMGSEASYDSNLYNYEQIRDIAVTVPLIC